MTSASVPTWMISVGFATSVATMASGCFWTTTKSEGNAMRKDINLLNERISTKEADLTVKMNQLQSVLEEATKLLKRNSADIGADVEGLRNDLRVSTGLVSAASTIANEVKVDYDRYKTATDERINTLDQRLMVLEGRAGISTTAVAGSSDTPEEIWAAASAAFEKKKWEEAREAFKKLAKFPTHDRADDAQYFRGETYFQQQEWDKSIVEYQRVFDKFPASSLADDALFRAAEAAEQLLNCSESRAYLSVLKQKYPKSSLLKKATEKDKDLKANAKNKSKCTS